MKKLQVNGFNVTILKDGLIRFSPIRGKTHVDANNFGIVGEKIFKYLVDEGFFDTKKIKEDEIS